MGLKNLAKMIKLEQKEASKTTEQLFIESIDSFLVSRPARPPSKTINPSSFYKCKRQLYYKLLDFPQNAKIFARGQRILGVGTALHEYIQEDVLMQMDEIELIPHEELLMYGAEGVEIIKEHNAPDMEVKARDYRFTKKYPLSYMVDGAFYYKNISYLFEFKTMNTKEFEYLIEPKKEHIAQGSLYALSIGIPRVMFVYMNKNTQDLKSYIITYTDDQLSWTKDRLTDLERSVLNLELPDEEECQNCRYCPYKAFCNKDEGGADTVEFVEEDGFNVYKKGD